MNNRRGWMSYLTMMILLLLVFSFVPTMLGRAQEATSTEYAGYLNTGKIKEAVVSQNEQVPTGSVQFVLEDGTRGRVSVPDVKEALETLEDREIPYQLRDVRARSFLDTAVFPILAGVAITIVLMMVFNRMAGGGGNSANDKMLTFGKSRARMDTNQSVRFDDVAGLREEKEDLEEIVDFLKNPSSYTSVGARIPKGVILVGPPGTGKTLLAKAVAGEAGVPFFSISGSDFVEMFVGVGASRVRDLFDTAKKNAPCIVFIDEIDAVGRRRGSGMGGGHDEREQTLNQLLVEMDGFGVNEGIIVMAATNRVDILDPAILRPGRFDRKIAVGKPDIRGREEILKVHAKNKPLGDDVDLAVIAQTTAGFTGADLENLLNEAAISAARQKKSYLTQQDIRDSFIKVGIGTEKKSKIISDKEKRITAYHEAGHAILFHVLPDMDPVYTISIIPTGMGAAGYTMPQNETEEMFRTRGQMLQEITVDLGGRVAEELILDDITTGASQDIKQATETARAMITRYGMSSRLGLVHYGEDSGEVFIGRDWGHTKNYSEKVASSIDEEVIAIVEQCHEEARRLIAEHRYVLDECARQLLAKEKLNRAEFEAIFEKEKNEGGGAGLPGESDETVGGQEETV